MKLTVTVTYSTRYRDRFGKENTTILNDGESVTMIVQGVRFQGNDFDSFEPQDEGIENFVKLGLEHNPNMRFVVQLSWGGGDIDNQDFPKGAFDNVDKEKTPEQLKPYNVRNITAPCWMLLSLPSLIKATPRAAIGSFRRSGR